MYAEEPARSRAQPPPPAAEAVREPDSTGHAPDAAAEEGATDVSDAPDADAAPPATVPESHLASEGADADPAPAPEPAPALDGDGDGEATTTTDTETREGADAAALATDGEPPSAPDDPPAESTSPDDKSVPLAADAPAEDDVSPTPEPSATAPISEPEPESAPEPEEPLTLDPRPMRLRVTLGGLPDDAADAPAMFFLKDSQKAALGDAEALDRGTQCGVIADPSGSLVALEQMLEQVFLPLFGTRTSTGDLFADNITAELLGDAGKFGAQVSRAVKRLAGDVEVTLPDVAVDDIERCAEDEHAVHILEDAVVEWTALVSASVKRESAKKAATGKGPLAEIEYWRDRNAALSSLYERLNSVEARDMVRVLEVAPHVGGAVVSNYRLAMAELTKLYAEAKDNAKFLTTLERHFKNITHYKAANNGAGTLAVVVDTVAPMINALRMVWIISRHYSDDVRMGGFMVRIADEIGDVVSAEINVSDPASGIFSLPVDVALEKVCLGRTLLETWKSTYMAMREKIELSGRDARWEFDRKQLFDRTDYMAGICADLERMLSVVDGFHKFLGPQLKAVTGEPEAIDAVISRVAAMAAAVQNVEFDAFDKRFFAIGLSSRPTFTGEKEAIERSAKVFIDASFKKLRSAEDAFDLLQSFKSIKSEGAIGKTMADKFNDILEQFTREIVETQEMFDAQHEDPPVLSNQPPVAGSITWSRGLFSRIRKTMNRLQADAAESMKKEPAAAMCHRKYTDLAKAAMKYEKRLYGTWVEGADAVALVRLKEPVLRTGRPESGEDAETSGEAKEPSAEDHVVVNFHPELIALLRESRYLDRMGFAIPETTLKVALQEDKFNACRQALYEMLQRYRAAVDRLSEMERCSSARSFASFALCSSPGTTRSTGCRWESSSLWRRATSPSTSFRRW